MFPFSGPNPKGIGELKMPEKHFVAAALGVQDNLPGCPNNLFILANGE